ncbi:MAG: hypothetical protein ISS36_01725 [Candidatus Aenigmarchaeota archaeon]|nr:hypothetical protein [Candidatus Aenigmarchaeota archaeon]
MRIQIDVPDNFQGNIIFQGLVPFEKRCPAYSFVVMREWVPRDDGYVCFFSESGGCGKCIIDEKYKQKT